MYSKYVCSYGDMSACIDVHPCIMMHSYQYKIDWMNMVYVEVNHKHRQKSIEYKYFVWTYFVRAFICAVGREALSIRGKQMYIKY